MKIAPSKPELAEAWVYGAVGATQGAYKHYIKPAIEGQPILAYALSGIIGGLVVSRLIDKSYGR